jgi:mevalonate pyrophosphate decarboxylase
MGGTCSTHRRIEKWIKKFRLKTWRKEICKIWHRWEHNVKIDCKRNRVVGCGLVSSAPVP